MQDILPHSTAKLHKTRRQMNDEQNERSRHDHVTRLGCQSNLVMVVSWLYGCTISMSIYIYIYRRRDYLVPILELRCGRVDGAKHNECKCIRPISTSGCPLPTTSADAFIIVIPTIIMMIMIVIATIIIIVKSIVSRRIYL